jgi:hypothetical protein
MKVIKRFYFSVAIIAALFLLETFLPIQLF